MLDPVMLEVKKLRTLQRKGNEMDKHKVLEKTRKYLVSIALQLSRHYFLCMFQLTCDAHTIIPTTT